MRLIFSAIEEESKEKAMPIYLALKIAAMVMGKEDVMPPFEEFIKPEQKYSNRDPEVVTQEYIQIAEMFEKARE